MQDILKEESKKESSKNSGASKEIKPKKDFVINQNGIYIELKKGEKLEVPKRFLENLKTEKVID